eukprot:XP_001691268.1 predicted protein [Chlamydomonas reinhardtii]
MASRFEEGEGPPQPPECANCGAVENLLRCSRCRTEWFCSLSCHKSYWPFHRQHCRRNEFADAVEEGGGDARFAAWLRRHGKQAVIGDAPKYSLEERQRVAERERREARQARLMSRQDAAWAAAVQTIAPGMGMECSRYSWTQNQSHVYVYARLLERGDSWGGGGGGASRLRVHLTPERLSVSLVHAGGGGGGGSKMPGSQPLPLPAAAGGDGGAGGPRTGPLAEAGSFRDDEDDERVEEEEAEVLFGGRLFAAVKAELSTWFVVHSNRPSPGPRPPASADDGVLTVSLLKRCRRGHYATGTTNANTWWRSVWAAADCPPGEALTQAHPPTTYYWSEYEEADLPEEGHLPPALPSPPAPATWYQKRQQHRPAAAALPAQMLSEQQHMDVEMEAAAEAEQKAASRWRGGKPVGRGQGKLEPSHVVTALAAGGADG